MAVTSKADNGSSKIASLTPQTREVLLHSILNYLHRGGFTKTLKRFRSEAQIQNDTWKASSVNLEEIYCKYMNACGETEYNAVVESETKPKKKKKNKHDIASGDEAQEAKSEAPKTPVDDTVNEPKKKQKEKKKKSKEQEADANKIGDVDVTVVTEEKKSSKKRKSLPFDEIENGHQSDKMETNQTAKKQRTGSAEPKTVNAFQRVKIDQVEFADEKLQDNSYWAKDGADVGYGAKAQEVLGQVRGRDFRHEKTKKKRGSYRGGQIDLQSHSVKFNYSDEE